MRRSLTLSSFGNAPLTVDQIKAHLRVLHDLEDDAIGELLAAAVDTVERRTGRIIRTATAVLTLDQFPAGDCPIVLPASPFRSMTSIAYTDDDGDPQTVSGAQVSQSMPAEIVPAYDAIWPTARLMPGAVVVTWACGYATAGDVPAKILQAIKLFCDLEYHEHQWLPATRIQKRIDDLLSGLCIRDPRLEGIAAL